MERREGRKKEGGTKPAEVTSVVAYKVLSAKREVREREREKGKFELPTQSLNQLFTLDF